MSEHHELVSAHLDGELGPEETARVEAALRDDPTVARHADDLASVRSMVRGLPFVEPPFGSLERIVRDVRRLRPSPRFVAATWGAAAAAIVLVVAVAPPRRPPLVTPDVDDLTARSELVATEPTSAVRANDADYAAVPVDDLDVEVPASLGGAPATAAYEGDDLTHVVYGDGAGATSVFVEEARLDWSGLPAGGRRTTVAGAPAWEASADGAEVVVLDVGDLVVVVVGPTVGAEAEAALDEVAAPEPGWTDGVVDACGGVAESFGFDL